MYSAGLDMGPFATGNLLDMLEVKVKEEQKTADKHHDGKATF